MKLTSNDLKGTGKVFRFQLKQLFVNKANIISLLITFVIILLSAPLISLFTGGFDSSDAPSTPEESDSTVTNENFPSKIYVLNETGLPIDISDSVYSIAENDIDTFSANAKDGEAFLHLSITEMGFNSKASYPSGDEELVASIGASLIEAAKASFDVGKTDILNSYYTTEIMDYSEYSSVSDDEDFSMDNYYIQLLYSIIVMLVSTYAVAYIVQSVVVEKFSKLIELLLISIKPLALILGKILAVMVFVLTLFAVNIGAFFLSGSINKLLGGANSYGALMESAQISLDNLSLTPATVAVVLISLILGYLTYSLISGLCASGCSEPEDAQSANSSSIMIIMICYVIALITSPINTTVLNVITSVFPFISIFCAPVQYMTGNIEFYVLIISWLLQIAVIFFLAYMCAKVYKDLIIYKGKRLSFFEIIKMSFGKKGRA